MKLKTASNQPNRIRFSFDGPPGFAARRKVAHCAGFSVIALMALITAVAAMTRANCRNSWPVIPGRKAAGRNTAVRTRVTPRIGPISSDIAFTAASRGDMPCSMKCELFSTTTMASSTTMPMARMSANSVIRLMLKPRAAIAAKAPMIVTGTVVAGTSTARKFCKNIMMTMRTSTPASISV